MMYLLPGVFLALWIQWAGLHILDPHARKPPLILRLLVLPGLILLWPWVWIRWSKAGGSDQQKGSRRKSLLLRQARAVVRLRLPGLGSSPRYMRDMQGRWVKRFAVITVLVAILGMVAPQQSLSSLSVLTDYPLEPEAFPITHGARKLKLRGMQAEARIRFGMEGQAQLELWTVTLPQAPALGIFWAPHAKSALTVPDQSLFLGRLTQTGHQRFLLPEGASHKGSLYVVSMVSGNVHGSVPMSASRGGIR